MSWPDVTVGDARIWITGEQSRTCDIVRSVAMWSNCPELTGPQARMVAAALLNAADELDEQRRGRSMTAFRR